jgi:hypothetical protein
MLKSKQYILIASVGLLMVVLYNLDIKGLIKPKEDRGMQTTTTATPEKVSNVSYKSVSDVTKQMISASLASDIEKIKQKTRLVAIWLIFKNK